MMSRRLVNDREQRLIGLKAVWTLQDFQKHLLRSVLGGFPGLEHPQTPAVDRRADPAVKLRHMFLIWGHIAFGNRVLAGCGSSSKWKGERSLEQHAACGARSASHRASRHLMLRGDPWGSDERTFFAGCPRLG